MALLATWALIRFWIHPMLVRHWIGGDAGVKMSRAGTLAALEMVRNQLLRLGIVLGFVLAALLVASVLTESDSVLPQAIIASTAAVAAAFDSVSGTVATVITLVTLLGAGIVLYRTSKLAHLRVRHALMVRFEAARATLNVDQNLHSVLSAQPEFADLYDRLTELEQLREGLSNGNEVKSQQALLELQQKIASARDQVLHQITVRYALRNFDPVEVLRVSKEPPSAPQASASSGSFWQRTRATSARVLASDGMAKDLGLVRTSFDRVGTALLVASLLTWSSQPLADSFRLAATNLEVTFQKETAEKPYQEAISKKPEVDSSDADDFDDVSTSDAQAVSRIITRALVDSMVRERFALTTNIRPVGGSTYASESVRSAILGAEVEPLGGSSEVDKLHGEALQQDAHSQRMDMQRENIAAKLEPEVARRVEELRQKNPGLWNSFARQAHSRYGTAMPVWSAQEKIVATAIGQALDVSDTHLESEIAKQGRKVAKEFGRKALTNWIDIQMQDFIGRTALQSALADIPSLPEQRAVHTALRPESRSMLNALAVQPSDTASKLHITHANLVVQDAVDRAGMTASIKEAVTDADPEVLARLQGYDALYPARETQLGSGTEPFGGGSGGAGGGGAAPGTAGRDGPNRVSASGSGPRIGRAASTNFMRAARSGFARGVLFGRTPETDAPGLADIRWSSRGDGKYAIEVLRVGNKSWELLGTFHATEINQALRFAADERVVAVTMVSGEPLARLAVHLHPALVDTPLGCRVIEIDRFVDTLDRLIPSVHRSREAAQSLSLLMRIAATAPEEICAAENIPSELHAVIASGRDLPAGFAANMRAALRQHDTSLAVADQAMACAQLADTSDAIKCACKKNPRVSYPLYVPIDITSQVREKNFTADSAFSWIRRSPDALGHVDFWLHMILSKVEPDGRAAALNTEDATIAVDFSSEDLATLNREVRPMIKELVESERGLNSNYEAFMRPVEDFIVLQRFFRIALSSGFGAQFPMAKLVRMERETKPSLQQQTTLRWQIDDEEQAQRLSEFAPGQYELWRNYQVARESTPHACGVTM